MCSKEPYFQRRELTEEHTRKLRVKESCPAHIRSLQGPLLYSKPGTLSGAFLLLPFQWVCPYLLFPLTNVVRLAAVTQTLLRLRQMASAGAHIRKAGADSHHAACTQQTEHHLWSHSFTFASSLLVFFLCWRQGGAGGQRQRWPGWEWQERQVLLHLSVLN